MKKLFVIGSVLLSTASMLTSCSPIDNISPDEAVSALVDFSFASDSTGGKRHGGKHNITQIEASALPTAVTGYISTNYAGSTISRAGKLEDGSFVVHVNKADGSHVGLKFDAEGKFLSEKTQKAPHKHITAAELPAAVTAYVTANYAGGTIEKAAVKEDGSFVVIVKKADATIVGAGFTAAGTFSGEVEMKGKSGKGRGFGRGPKKG